MKKYFVVFAVLLCAASVGAKAQNTQPSNTVEFTCQIVEGKDGSIKIVSNYDYLGESFWKTNIESKVFRTKQEA